METKDIDYINPDLRLPESTSETGSVGWESPSNIALVKYWGKYGRQRPRNPSLSLTLKHAHTRTQIRYRRREIGYEKGGINLDFAFEGQARHPFGRKVREFLETLVPIFPFLEQLDLEIESQNSFPHSSGIASSASSMSALALCLCSMEQAAFHTLSDKVIFQKKASYVARLGSGSACRSIYPVAALWGHWPELPASSDLYALPCQEEIHPVFENFHDSILIVDRKEKSVSSRAGHGLMEGNPFADARYRQAQSNLGTLWEAMKKGDLMAFGQIVEAEALGLHALMMCSTPPFILLKPATLAIISRVQALRQTEQIPVFVSLDAGPNIHLLYPDEQRVEVRSFIEQELLPFCQDGKWIDDQVGTGPQMLIAS